MLRPSRETLANLYVSQQLSSTVIGPMLGFDPATVRRWLRRYGLSRSPKEAHTLRAARQTAEYHARNAARAHDAVRGMKRTDADLCARAATKEQRQSHVSDLDRQLANWLGSESWFDGRLTLSKAIGPYNVDIGVEGAADSRLAVEVFGGSWHATGRAAARWPKRVRYLLDHGWRVCVVWSTLWCPLTERAAFEIANASLNSYVFEGITLNADYIVLRGNGERLVLGCDQDEAFPVQGTRRRGYCLICEHLI